MKNMVSHLGTHKQKSLLLLGLNHCFPDCSNGLWSREYVNNFAADAHGRFAVALLKAERNALMAFLIITIARVMTHAMLFPVSI